MGLLQGVVEVLLRWLRLWLLLRICLVEEGVRLRLWLWLGIVLCEIGVHLLRRLDRVVENGRWELLRWGLGHRALI